MGKIKKDIKNLSKESGSKVKARRAAESWFEKASKSIKDKSVAKYSKPFKVGMIHVFRYEKPTFKKTKKPRNSPLQFYSFSTATVPW